ncbi:hypothetical protein A1O3_02735 [Capronia epimyces CBS 606.96]|uniref:Uncharacterized protein n=1 Tax=Capronia epimyces CBS 606.96 TaxID=1182542 RepID=W9YAW3_9EURO|nr:uncharacterized protein A1O3_02735 [Capronia epimyces CBS 606.96]EXJ89668.1 hypothetical protein A1O3_02735 [Capronia epimyces CBS 606.96]
MTDIADPVDAIMHHATTHASTMPDPPTLTSAPVASPAAPAHPPRHSSPDSALPHSPARPAALNITTSVASSTNHLAAGQDDSTPPTSAISSQEESQETGSPVKVEDKQDAGKETVQVPRSASTSQSPLPEAVSGTKRTASGQVKRASVNGMGDVITRSTDGAGHSRTSSTTSNGGNGNVLELSQQLRTKLKYAMIKVQNGWQSRSFDEVESLASQSPRSTVSGFHPFNNDPQTLLSPKTAMSRKLYQRESSESDSSDSTVALEARGLTTANAVGSPHAAVRRSLAPPVDIMPGSGSGSGPGLGSRRRPTPNAAYHGRVHPPPPVRTNAKEIYASRPTNSKRTPSQNAAMEADAVETLMFMASPNNSGYNPASHASQDSSSLRTTAPPGSTLTSPLRTQFSQASIMTSPKRVAFSDAGSSSTDHAVFDKNALIDRILDELSDTSDDELEQAFRLAEKSNPAATVSS